MSKNEPHLPNNLFEADKIENECDTPAFDVKQHEQKNRKMEKLMHFFAENPSYFGVEHDLVMQEKGKATA